MITGLIIAAVAGFLSFVGGLLPDLPDPASVVGQTSGAWGTVISYMAGASGWFPFGFAFTCMAAVAVLGTSAGGVKLVRMIASFLTGGGGSSA